jgi:hypothetical protein
MIHRSIETPDFSIDDIRGFAVKVRDRELSPANAARLIVASQIETDHGMQPKFFIVGSAREEGERKPAVQITFRDGEWRTLERTERGGTHPAVRVGSHVGVGLWGAFGDRNRPMQRIITGGLGLDDKYDLNVSGWEQTSATSYRILPSVWDYVRQHPAEEIGVIEAIANDGSSFLPSNLPNDVAGQYASANREGHATVASFPVHGAALLALPNIVMISS